mgnify:CR=1 FL=1
MPMLSSLKAEVKKNPALYEFFKRIYPPGKFFRRLFKPAFLWPFLYATSPISNKYGLDRGRSIDRYFIEQFLKENNSCIRGACLEIKDNTYTKRYGGFAVSKSDVLDIDTSNTKANIYDDIRTLKLISDSTYDCIILTQVLQFIDDYEAAIRQCYRVLKSDGHLLATLPFISRIDIGSGAQGDFWRFSTASARYIFGKYFPKENLRIESRGNVLTGIGFWAGLSQEDMPIKRMSRNDPNFPLLISVVAKK